jgi:Transposase DDE domain group 1
MSAGGKGQLGHAGGVVLQLLAEKTGLDEALTGAMRLPGFWPLHPRGRVLVDLACAIVLGAEAIGDIALSEHQRAVLGPTASAPTVWRTLDETGELQRRRIARARAAVRRRVRGLLRERRRVPVDHGRRATAGRLDRAGLRRHPGGLRLREGGRGGHLQEGRVRPVPPAGVLRRHRRDARPGAAAGGRRLQRHRGQHRHLPAGRRAGPRPAPPQDLVPDRRRRLLLRAAEMDRFRRGTGPPFLHLGVLHRPDLHRREMDAVPAVDALERRTGRPLWEAALQADGTVREHAFVVEVTGLLGDLSAWPPGHQVFVRREPLHPRYARDANAYETEHGVRLTAFATNTQGRQPARLDLRHRAHSRVEPKIRDSKAESLARFPSRFMKINQAWLTATALACDLRAWLQLLGCDGHMAKATPKTLRYRFLHVPARLVHGQRRRRLKIPSTWPWADQIVEAFWRIRALPAPT